MPRALSNMLGALDHFDRACYSYTFKLNTAKP